LDIVPVKENLFGGKEIMMISGKFKVCGALVKDNSEAPAADA